MLVRRCAEALHPFATDDRPAHARALLPKAQKYAQALLALEGGMSDDHAAALAAFIDVSYWTQRLYAATLERDRSLMHSEPLAALFSCPDAPLPKNAAALIDQLVTSAMAGAHKDAAAVVAAAKRNEELAQLAASCVERHLDAGIERDSHNRVPVEMLSAPVPLFRPLLVRYITSSMLWLVRRFVEDPEEEERTLGFLRQLRTY